MFTYEFLQNYWWVIISLLGGLLVFLMFVQGGNSFIFFTKDEEERQMIVNSTGRKWELTFTTLVTFGGAFFASFPLFYSTSFGGAYWVWILLLVTFVFQAVSYEFQTKLGNLLGRNTFRAFLLINGCLGPPPSSSWAPPSAHSSPALTSLSTRTLWERASPRR